MDDFGVFTESFGLKPQGKAAPMAAFKTTPALPTTNSHTSNPYDNARFSDHDFDVFAGSANSIPPNQSSFNYDSFFSASNSAAAAAVSFDGDDIFGVASNGVFGSSVDSAPIGDLLGDFVTTTLDPKSSKINNNNSRSSYFNGDDLISGIGTSVAQNNRINEDKYRPPTKSVFISAAEDPFFVLQSTSTSTSASASDSSDLFSDPLEKTIKVNSSVGAKPPRLKSPPKSTHKANSSGVSSIDELENFAMGLGRVQNNKNGRSYSHSNGEHVDDLESFFSAGPRSSSAPKSRSTTSDPIFDALNNNKGTKGPQPRAPPNTSSGTSSIKKSSSAGGIFGDLSSMFEGAHIYGEFEEVAGESDERRSARFGRLKRTNERVAKAVADMNQRDLQSQHEQDERRRIAEALDVDIKRWAAGKEGNMRALLSSLQNVLWAECGWEPVSLTDLITSTSVKKVYRKATLCIHPDKVQQKGASLQQKYTAEKVFDILKEAWNKFNKEELR